MKKIMTFSIILFLLSFSIKDFAQPNMMKKYHLDGRQEVYASNMLYGNYVFTGGVPTDVGVQDAFVMMVDSVGNLIWSKRFNVSVNEFTNTILEKDSILYVVGTGSTNLGFIIKMTWEGEIINVYRYFGSPSLHFSRSNLVDDHIYVGFTAYTDEGTYPALMKVALDGSIVWSKRYKGGGQENVYWVSPAEDGGFLLTGWTGDFGVDNISAYAMKVDENGLFLWGKTYEGVSISNGYQIVETSDHNLFLTCRYSIDDYFHAGIYRLDEMGDTLWTKVYKTEGTYSRATIKIFEMSDGNFIIRNSIDHEIGEVPMHAKIDPEGNILWERNYPYEIDYNSEETLFETPDGGIFTSASFFTDGQEDFGFIKTDSVGLGVCTADLFDYDIVPTGLSYHDIFFEDTVLTLAGTPTTGGEDVIVEPFMVCCDSIYADFTFEALGDGTFLFEANPMPAATYSWTFGGVAYEGQEVIYEFPSNGEVEVCLYASNFCNSDSICENVSLLEIQERAHDKFNIYPNPFNETVRITSINGTDRFNCIIFNQSGKKVFQSSGYSDQLVLNASSFPKGVYVIRLVSENGEVHMSKVVKL
jgi:hypothetical protein